MPEEEKSKIQQAEKTTAQSKDSKETSEKAGIAQKVTKKVDDKTITEKNAKLKPTTKDGKDWNLQKEIRDQNKQSKS